MRSLILLQPKMGYYDLVVNDIPLGLLSVSRYVKDHKITVIDQRMEGWEKELKNALSLKPAAVGLTVTTGGQIHYALEVSRAIKKEHKDIPVVWGGVHPTMLPEETLENPAVDIVVSGQAEYTFPGLLKALEEKDLSGAHGVFYKEGGAIKSGPAADKELSLNDLSLLPYHLVDFNRYTQHANYMFGNVLSIETGRGCPYKCTYCYNSTKMRRRMQVLSAEKIMEHIRHLRRHVKFDGINFVDDTFFIKKDRVLRLVELLKKEKERFHWGCETGVRELLDMSGDQLKELEETGLKWILLGAESGSRKILDKIDKKLEIREVIELNKKLSGYKFYPMYNFMNGYIWEDRNDLKESCRLVLKLLKENRRANMQTFHIVVPYPGTGYLESCVNAGLKRPGRLENWKNYNPDDWIDTPPWLDKKRKLLLKALYIASIYIDRKVYINVMNNGLLVFFLRLFRALYYPIAYLRFRYCRASLALEVRIFYAFKRFFLNLR